MRHRSDSPMFKQRVPTYFYGSLRKLTIPFIDRESDSYRFLSSIKCINMTTIMLVRAPSPQATHVMLASLIPFLRIILHTFTKLFCIYV